jgi:hypothetical protein
MNNRKMGWWGYQLCRLILLLDWFPRYGRLYQGIELSDGSYRLKRLGWRWQRHGRWGINLLSRLDLLWAYLGYQIAHGMFQVVDVEIVDEEDT